MKKVYIVIALNVMSLLSFSAIKSVDISSGETVLSSRILPYGTCELIGFETLMCQGGGQCSLTLGKKISGYIPRTEYITYYVTNKVVRFVNKACDYDIKLIFENIHYDSSEKKVITEHSYYTNSFSFNNVYNMKATKDISPYGQSFDLTQTEVNSNGWTNVSIKAVWKADPATMVTTTSSTNIETRNEAQVIDFRFYYDVALRVDQYLNVHIDKKEWKDVYITNYIRYVDHIVTNKWNEVVTRICDTSLVPLTSLTNGCFVTYFDNPLYLFTGDILKCTSPITTNNPGQVRLVIRDDSAGTVNVTGD